LLVCAVRSRRGIGVWAGLSFEAMSLTWKDGRTLTDLVDEMTEELLGQVAEVPGSAEAIDWTNLRDERVQTMLVGLVAEHGEATRSDVQARVAHLPGLAERVPNFCGWAARQGFLRVVRHGDQGEVFGLGPKAEALLAQWGPIAPPPGSTPLT
jgi:hypothetical protein